MPASAQTPVLREVVILCPFSSDCVEKPRFSVRSQLARPMTRAEKFCLEVRLTQAVAGGRASWAHQWHLQRQSRHADQQMRFSTTGRFRSYFNTIRPFATFQKRASASRRALVRPVPAPFPREIKAVLRFHGSVFGARARPRSVLQIRTSGAAADGQARSHAEPRSRSAGVHPASALATCQTNRWRPAAKSV